VKAFTYVRAHDVADAAGRIDGDHVAYAGGTDLLPRVKLGISEPVQLVDLKRSGLSDGIEPESDRIVIGALTTLSTVEHSALIAERCTALAEAASLAATPQIRNRATLAGNLLQRPRCWYYRDPTIDCWLKGGIDCPAREGRNEHHAIFDRSPCVAVHPSDLAACLLALDASVTVAGRDASRSVAVTDLFAAPSDERRTETVLRPDELITTIEIPDRGMQSTYRKAMDRAAWAFALVGAACAVQVDGDRCTDARIVLSGVANTPHRATSAEELLRGATLDDATIDAAARETVQGAQPLRENRYKQQLAVALTRDALTVLASVGRAPTR
jgi:xanthine dehydrogenase YagS FAD-binding subunit